MRLICADAVEKQAYDDVHYHAELEDWEFDVVTHYLDHAPTIDAVPVVRCKDCAYRRPTIDEITHEVDGHWCDLLDLKSVEDDDFCCWGDRKDG